MSLETCHPSSPRRAVDWRWRTAACLRHGLLPVHCGWADGWVDRVVAFQEALDDPDGVPHRPRLAELDPALAAAYRLRLGGGRPIRWHVESLLLAGEGDASIAGRCGIPVDVVAAYAHLFFDVRTKLEQTSYVLHQAINVNQGRPEHAVGRAWKMLGYGGGPLAVDFMAAGANDSESVDHFDVVGPAAPQDRHARLRRMVVTALTLDLDPAAARRMVPLVESMEEVDRRASDASCRPIDGSFAAMVDGLDLTPGRSQRGDDGLDGGGESRPTGDDPRSDAGHEARADFGAEAPLRRVGS